MVVFAATPEQARQVAAEVAHKAYWNSSYCGGPFRELDAVSTRMRQATMVPLYQALGFTVTDHFQLRLPDPVEVPVARMSRNMR